MADTFYEASIGGVRLWIATLDTDAPRMLVKQQATRGDDVEVDDRGRGEHSTSVELLFAAMPGETESPKTRFNRFRALVDKGNGTDGYYFTHPVEGTYRVAIGDFRYSLANGVLRASATFTRMGVVTAITPIGPAVSPEAGLEAVTSAADAAIRALADVGLDSVIPGEAVAAADGWTNRATSAREVFTELASVSQDIQDEIAGHDLTGDLQLWGAYKTLISLGASVLGAADAATADARNVFGLLVERCTPLRSIVTRTYGSRRAADLYEQIMRLNDISTPARIPAGTTLTMPALEPVPRGA